MDLGECSSSSFYVRIFNYPSTIYSKTIFPYCIVLSYFDHKCENLFLGPQFYLVGLYVCLFASTMLSWLLQFCGKFWNQKLWLLQIGFYLLSFFLINFFFFKVMLDPVNFLIDYRISSSISAKKPGQILLVIVWLCNRFGKYVYVNNIKCLYPWT